MTAPTTATKMVDKAPAARMPERTHDKATHNGTDDADDDVAKHTIAAALHDLPVINPAIRPTMIHQIMHMMLVPPFHEIMHSPVRRGTCAMGDRSPVTAMR
jgi:hypothetical protein